MKEGTKTKTETISLSEFARQMEIGEKTIRDAVKLGKLSKGVILINGKSKILPAIAKKEFEAFRIGTKAKPTGKPTVEPVNDNSKMSYAEATRRNAVFKQRLSELELEEKEKTLVNKAEVYSQLFAFGQQIKVEFENLPMRVGHKLVGCEVNEIYTILAAETYETLTRLTKAQDQLKIG